MGATIFGAIIGAIIAGLITIWIEGLRKPKLELELLAPFDLNLLPNQPASKMRSLRVKLTNKSLPRWIKWMYRNPALQCHGTISFYHLNDRQDVFGRKMILRWSGAPEPNPLKVQIGNQQGLVYDPVRITLLQKMDIYPNESADIDIAVRMDKDVECYGWSNENYFSNPPWRPKNWQLKSERYLVKVTVLSSGETKSKIFRLINDVDLQDFRLTDALPEDNLN
mgnify:CR=1 FL=1